MTLQANRFHLKVMRHCGPAEFQINKPYQDLLIFCNCCNYSLCFQGSRKTLKILFPFLIHLLKPNKKSFQNH